MPHRVRSLLVVAGAALAAPLAAGPLAAQLPGIGLGASLGATLPTGRHDEDTRRGVVANLFGELRLGAPVGVRGSLFWSRSDIDNPIIRRVGTQELPRVSSSDVTGNVNLVGASADLTYDLGRSFIRPYLIGGVGIYRRRVSQDVAGAAQEFRGLRTAETETGYNGGVGLRLSLGIASVFGEARYYSVRTTPERTNFIPVMVGLSF